MVLILFTNKIVVSNPVSKAKNQSGLNRYYHLLSYLQSLNQICPDLLLPQLVVSSNSSSNILDICRVILGRNRTRVSSRTQALAQ